MSSFHRAVRNRKKERIKLKTVKKEEKNTYISTTTIFANVMRMLLKNQLTAHTQQKIIFAHNKKQQEGHDERSI